MTEIAFLVKPDSEMYRKYFKQKNELDKFVGFASSFIDKYFVSRNKDFDYSFSTNMRLTVKLPPNDEEWFGAQLMKEKSESGLYKEQKLAEYKKAPSEDLIQAKLFHDSVPKSGQVKVTLDIDGKQFVGSFDSKFFGYTGANLDEAILPEAGFKYPDSFEGYYEFLKDNGINIECKDGMFPFTFVKEIAAFRGDKIFWKREA